MAWKRISGFIKVFSNSKRMKGIKAFLEAINYTNPGSPASRKTVLLAQFINVL